MHKDRERRKYKRIEKPYMARLRVKQYEGLEISSAEWVTILLKDLGAGGAIFDYNKNLELGSLLDLKIRLKRFLSDIYSKLLFLTKHNNLRRLTN